MARDTQIFVDGIGLVELAAEVSAVIGAPLVETKHCLAALVSEGRVTVRANDALGDEFDHFAHEVNVDGRGAAARIDLARRIYERVRAVASVRALLIDDDEGVLAVSDAA